MMLGGASQFNVFPLEGEKKFFFIIPKAFCIGVSGKIPWRRKQQPTPVLLPGESHGGRSLVGYIPWGRKESDTTERFYFHFLFLNDQRKEIVENNRMRKTRPLFKKIRDT